MVIVEYFRRSILEDPSYRKEQERLIALCDGKQTRTWELWWCLQHCGIGHRGAEAGAWPMLSPRAFAEKFEHFEATDNFSWAKRPHCVEGNPSPSEWQEELGRGIKAYEADLTRLPWFDRELDCLAAISVLEHVEDDLQALREMLRSAKRVVFTTDVAREPVGYFNYGRVYSPETLRKRLHEATGQSVVLPEFPAQREWMYPEMTCVGVKIEGH